jgi:hypothetical protein
MDARRRSLRARTAKALVCALALLPAAQARADAPPAQPDAPSLEQEQPATPEPLAPTQQPLEPDVVPQEPAPTAIVPAPAPVAEVPQAAAEVPDQAPPPAPAQIPAPPEPSDAPKPKQVRATTPPPPPARAKVDTLLRRADRRIGHARSHLRAGRKPTEGLLRNLRQDVQALPPAVVVLERHADARGDDGVEGVKRRLRRVLATTGSLVAALARSGIQTPESARLARMLAALTGTGSPDAALSEPRRGRAARREPGAAHRPREAAAQPAYTQSEAAPPRLGSAIAAGTPETSVATDPQSLTRLDAPAASDHDSTLVVAAVALLLVLTLSNSLSWLLMSRWGQPAA